MSESVDARFRILVEHSGDGIVLLDAGGRVRFASPGAERLLGIPAAELEGVDPASLMHPDDARTAARHLRACLAAPGEPLRGTYRLRHRDGRWVHFENVAVNRLDDPEVGAIVANFRDVTVRAEAEAALEESRWLLEKAQEVGHVGSWISDPDPEGGLSWSDETCRIFGVAPGAFDGRVETFFAFIHPDDAAAVRAASAAALRGERPYEIEHRIVRPDGTVRVVAERADVVRDPDGRAVRMIGVVQDVTERRELEERVRQAGKMEALGRLAGGVAHDFNNLLTVVLGQGELVLQELHDPDGGRGTRERMLDILAAGRRLAALTQQLLAFSRRQVLRPQSVDLAASVVDLQPVLVRLLPTSIALEVRPGRGVPPASADPTQLQQVILNLVLNARDALPRGGTIRISTGEVAVDGAGGDRLAPGTYSVLTVSDDGDGMTPEVQKRVFEPFFTTKPVGKGTGLGLATVYGIVEQSGGQVRVESAPGRGSRFDVLLPQASPAAVEPEGEEVLPTVLVVEDDDSVRMLTTDALEEAGYQVLALRSPEAALELVARQRVDLLLTDVVMPGMSGVELARRAAEICREIPVLYMSGYSAELVERGADGLALLEKPFSPQTLCDRVRQALANAAARV